MYDAGYPPIPFMSVPVPVWPDHVAMEFLWRRINLHLEAEESPDDELPLCTPEEQWAKPARYAVKKKGNKKARKLCESQEEAEQLISTLKDSKAYGIEFRPPQRIRCESYCNAKNFCFQFQAGGIKFQHARGRSIRPRARGKLRAFAPPPW